MGSIPAWAGKPSSSSAGDVATLGLSPRGQGKAARMGSIPAWAGKPRRRGDALVYPRVPVPAAPRGGSIPAWAGKPRRTPPPDRTGTVSSAEAVVLDGLSPRGRGNLRRFHSKYLSTWASGLAQRGLSPRGRGNRRFCQPSTFTLSPRGLGNLAEVSRVYPRVGGETPGVLAQFRRRSMRGRGTPPPFVGTFLGLSPRGRGNPTTRTGAYRLGSIPAWAGKPRSSGSWRGLSPRGRGNRCQCAARLGRSIARVDQRFCRVYPRVGGET